MHKLSDSELADLLREARNEAYRRASGDTAAMIRGHEAAKRAAVIAAVGGHSVCFVGPPGCGKTLLRALAAELGAPESFEGRPCPCGNKNNPLASCACTLAQIKRHRIPVAQVNIELWPVPLTAGAGSSTEKLRAVVKQAGPRPSETLCQFGRELLKTSAQEFGLSAAVVADTKRIAATIAAIESAERILPCHVTEAVNYRPLRAQAR